MFITCHVKCVTCHVLQFFLFFCLNKLMELVNGWSIINRAYPFYFLGLWQMGNSPTQLSNICGKPLTLAIAWAIIGGVT